MLTENVGGGAYEPAKGLSVVWQAIVCFYRGHREGTIEPPFIPDEHSAAGTLGL